MGSYDNCKDWDYANHPKRSTVTERCKRLTKKLLRSPRSFDRFAFDTRPGHAFVFRGMAPDECACLIGNYRGSSHCPELAQLYVKVDADPKVGISPSLVASQMGGLEKRCQEACDGFEGYRTSKTGSKAPPEVVLLRFVQVLCEALEQFLLIHPYANGNGHMGRLLVWVMMTRYGFPPYSWPLDSRPAYDAALYAFRRGEKKQLISVVLQSMRPPVSQVAAC